MVDPLPAVCVIGGSDPSGGSGVQADVRTCSDFGVHPLSVVTLITVQDAHRVHDVQPLPASLVSQQLQVLLSEFSIQAVKIGALGNAEIADTLSQMLPGHIPIVIDPVLFPTQGEALYRAEIQQSFVRLLRQATLVTPNIPEAVSILGQDIDEHESAIATAAQNLHALLGASVLLKGGHSPGETSRDCLVVEDGPAKWFTSPRIPNGNVRGTGCKLSTAIACDLALGKPLGQAVEDAKQYLTQKIVAARLISGNRFMI